MILEFGDCAGDFEVTCQGLSGFEVTCLEPVIYYQHFKNSFGLMYTKFYWWRLVSLPRYNSLILFTSIWPVIIFLSTNARRPDKETKERLFTISMPFSIDTTRFRPEISLSSGLSCTLSSPPTLRKASRPLSSVRTGLL